MIKNVSVPISSFGNGTNIATGSLVSIERLVDMEDWWEDKAPAMLVPGGCFRLKSQFSSQSSTDWWHWIDLAGLEAGINYECEKKVNGTLM